MLRVLALLVLSFVLGAPSAHAATVELEQELPGRPVELEAQAGGGTRLLLDDAPSASGRTLSVAVPGGPFAAPVPFGGLRLSYGPTSVDETGAGVRLGFGSFALRAQSFDPSGAVTGSEVLVRGDRRHAILDAGLVVGPDGTALVTWVQFDGAQRVQRVRVRAPGGSFGPAQTLPRSRRTSSAARAVAGPHGDGLLVEEDAERVAVIRASRMRSVRVIPRNAAIAASMADDGAAVVATIPSAGPSERRELRAAALSPAATRVPRLRTVASRRARPEPVVLAAATPAGPIVGWQRAGAVELHEGAGLATRTVLSDPLLQSYPLLLAGADGTLAVTSSLGPTDTAPLVTVAVRPPGGSFTSASSALPGGDLVSEYLAAVTADGRVVVATALNGDEPTTHVVRVGP